MSTLDGELKTVAANSYIALYCKRSRSDSTALSVYQRLSSAEKSFIEKRTSEMRKPASLQAFQGATITDEEVSRLRKQLILYAIAKTLEVDDQKEPYMLWTKMCDGIQYPQICGNVWFNVPTIFPSVTDGSGHSYASVGHRTSQLCQRHQGSTKIDFSYPQISLRCPLLVWTEVLAENEKSRLSSTYSDGLPSIWPGEGIREKAGLRGPLFANCGTQILILLSNLLDPRSCSALIKELLKSDYAQAKEFMGSENVSKYEMWVAYFDIWLKGLGIGKPKRLTSWEDYDVASGISIISFQHPSTEQLQEPALATADHAVMSLPADGINDKTRSEYVYHMIRNPTGLELGRTRLEKFKDVSAKFESHELWVWPIRLDGMLGAPTLIRL